ncbi:hypothetical protein HK405_014709, partial [Cladochytrium tenue]
MSATTAPANAAPLRQEVPQTDCDAAQLLGPRTVAPLDSAVAAALLQAPPRGDADGGHCPSSGHPPNEADERDEVITS